jgi:hypothetical protein
VSFGIELKFLSDFRATGQSSYVKREMATYFVKKDLLFLPKLRRGESEWLETTIFSGSSPSQ